MGGMAAFIPSRRDAAVNEIALEKVREDKEREAAQGFDGTYRSGFINRWRLVPKDPAAYRRGELVEPVTPVIYYLDPGIPAPYREALREGGNWWGGGRPTTNALVARTTATAATTHNAIALTVDIVVAARTATTKGDTVCGDDEG